MYQSRKWTVLLSQRITFIAQWLGFNHALFTHAYRTALASGFALACGWWLGLDHPQWAAMSVWAATIPLQKKGMVVEKGLFRLLGTLIGTLVGMLLLYLCQGDILYIAIGLTIWITLCTGAGNLFHGFVSYLTLLSGYTASLVLVLEMTQGECIYALGLDRMLTVSVGVVTAMLVGLLFAKPACENSIGLRIKCLTQRVLSLLVVAKQTPIATQQIACLLKEAAAIDAILDAHGAGSLASRRSVRSIRSIIYANVALLSRLTDNAFIAQLGSIEMALAELQRVVEQDCGLAQEIVCLDAICHQLDEGELKSIFTDLHLALTQRLRYKQVGHVERSPLLHMTQLHRDWLGAQQAMLRSCLVLGTIGVIWHYSESALGGFVMLGTSVMISLFSTFEAPATLMKRMILWQGLGLAASLLVSGFFWAHASSEAQCVLIMILFILPVIIPMSCTRFSVGSMDYVMMFLLLSNIRYPIDFQLAESLPLGAAAVGGAIVAFMAFSMIFPTNAGKRNARIRSAIYSDLQRVRDSQGKHRYALHHGKAQHRLLKLIHSDTQMSTTQLVKTLKVVARIQLATQSKKPCLASD